MPPSSSASSLCPSATGATPSNSLTSQLPAVLLGTGLGLLIASFAQRHRARLNAAAGAAETNESQRKQRPHVRFLSFRDSELDSENGIADESEAIISERHSSRKSSTASSRSVDQSETSLSKFTSRRSATASTRSCDSSIGGRGKLLKRLNSMRPTESTMAAFQKLDKDGDGVISRAEFHKVCMEDLGFDLSCVELDRIFLKYDVDGSDVLTPQEFFTAVTGGAIFRNIKEAILDQAAGFQVSDSYNFEVSTNENYNVDTKEFYGDYEDIRAARDYSYHVNYTKQRQLWQDSTIKRVVQRTERQVSPWCVFTCGPMGAGKGYALSWMSTHGFFPVEGMVHVDPDHFKRCMPEFNDYRSAGKEAGSMCHRESAFMQEIAQEAALRTGQHVWVDGSLKDAVWFSGVFDDIRTRFPQYRIAVFYVYASEKVVRERCDYRAKVTGRAIPESLMLASLREPKESLAALTSKSDFIARINNEHAVPLLEAVAAVDRSGCWENIQSRFAHVDKHPNEFPNFLAPVHLKKTSESLVDGLQLIREEGTADDCAARTLFVLEPRTSHVVPVTPRHREALGLSPESRLTLIGSRIDAVTLPADVRKAAGIPADAFSVSWIGNFLGDDGDQCMTHDDDRLEVLRGLSDDEELSQILKYGAFVFLDAEDTVVQVSAAAQANDDRTSEQYALQFGPCEDMPEDVADALRDQDRWWPVTVKYLTVRGVTEHCWVRPGERIEGKTFSAHGAFAYFLPSLDRFIYFSVMD